MLNLGGLFGAIGRMLPGYIQGREQAIQSNWNDLNQYNQVQAGQINNAFGELTFPQRYNMFMDEAAISRASNLQSLMNLGVRARGLPYELTAAAYRSAYGPQIEQARIGRALNPPQMGGGGSDGMDDFTATLERVKQLREAWGGTAQQQPAANESLMRTQTPTAAASNGGVVNNNILGDAGVGVRINPFTGKPY